MCDRDLADVVIQRGRIWCDPCLAPLVRALNDGGAPTAASCCGHSERLGSIALVDGRQLVIVPGLEVLNALSREPTLVAGASAPGAVDDRRTD